MGCCFSSEARVVAPEQERLFQPDENGESNLNHRHSAFSLLSKEPEDGGFDGEMIMTKSRRTIAFPNKTQLMVTPSPLFRIEGNLSLLKNDDPSFRESMNRSKWVHTVDIKSFEEKEMKESFYKTIFFSNPHFHFVGHQKGVGVVCVSAIVLQKAVGFGQDHSLDPVDVLFLVRDRARYELIQVNLPDRKEILHFSFSRPPPTKIRAESKPMELKYLSSDRLLKLLLQQDASLRSFSFSNIIEVKSGEKNIELCNKLCEYEISITPPTFLVGVLFCKEGQTSEKEIFSNANTSVSFASLLDLLGEKIIVDESNQQNFFLPSSCPVFLAEWGGVELTFHVAPLLPSSLPSLPDSRDPSSFLSSTEELPSHSSNSSHSLDKAESSNSSTRMKLIENDQIVIVFVEGNQGINPEIFTSKEHQVFIFLRSSSSGSFHIQVARKKEIPQFEPKLTEETISTFLSGNSFRNFLFSKIVNAQKAINSTQPNQSEKRQEDLRRVLNTKTKR